MKKIKFFALWALLLTPPLLLSGCGDDATDDPTPGKTPVLTIKDNALGVINVEAAGQTVTLNYEVADAVEGKLAVAKSDKEWIHDFDCETFGQITFVADENVGEELTRSATVTISYPGAESVAVEVAQNERAISIEVTEVTVASIKAKLETDDPAQTFLFNLVKKSDYDAIGSPEKFLEKELKALEEEALDSDGWFTSLEEYLDFLLSDWNPEGQNLNRDELEINTEYYIYAYGIDVKGEITTPLVRRLVKTNDLKEINFNLTVEDEGQTTATLKGNPDEKFTYYYLGYTSKTEYEDSFKGDDQQVIDNALGSIRMGIGNDGSKLPDVASVRMGEGSLEVEGLLPDTEYYALAFGIDNSVSACTKLTKTPFKTDAVAITDDCKFEVSVLDVNSILMNIAVKPSKATTRYFATVKATDEVKNMTPAQVADAEIAFQNGFTPPVDWSTDPRVFTGDQTLHSRRNLGVTIIKPETDYTVYVFGVSAEGVRTTEVATATTRTTAVVPSSMTLEVKDVKPGSETDPNDFFGGKLYYFQYGVKPSIDTEYYYTGIVKKSTYETFADDEAFMKDVVGQAGELIMMNCFMGENNAGLVSTPTPFKGSAEYSGTAIAAGEQYYIFAFGYMGAPTTALFKVDATAAGDGGSGGSNVTVSGAAQVTAIAGKGDRWDGAGATIGSGSGGSTKNPDGTFTPGSGQEIQANISGLITGWIHHIIYDPALVSEDNPDGILKEWWEPEYPQPNPEDPNAPAEESNEVDLGTPGLHVETLEGSPLPFDARQQGSTLRVTSNTLAARLHGTRQALEALREQGVEQIQFVTTLKTTTLSVEDLLAEGGSWFALEHDGLVSRRLSAAQAESLKCWRR